MVPIALTEEQNRYLQALVAIALLLSTLYSSLAGSGLVFPLITLIVGTVLIGILIGPQINSWMHTRRREKERQEYVEDRLGSFVKLVNRFGEYMDLDRIDNIPYILSDKMTDSLNLPDRRVMADAFNGFEETLSSLEEEGTLDRHFEEVVSQFDSFVKNYNKHYVKRPLEEAQQEEVKTHTLNKFTEVREDYVRFLQDYKEFAKDVSDNLNLVLASHLDHPPKLSGSQ